MIKERHHNKNYHSSHQNVWHCDTQSIWILARYLKCRLQKINFLSSKRAANTCTRFSMDKWAKSVAKLTCTPTHRARTTLSTSHITHMLVERPHCNATCASQFFLDVPLHRSWQHHLAMSFSDRRRRRRFGGEERVKGKYILWRVTGTEICCQPVINTATGTHPSFNHQQTPKGRDIAPFYICSQTSVPKITYSVEYILS